MSLTGSQTGLSELSFVLFFSFLNAGFTVVINLVFLLCFSMRFSMALGSLSKEFHVGSLDSENARPDATMESKRVGINKA